MAQEFKVPVGVPRLTTSEKNALSSPQKGWMVYDLTLDQLQQYNGTAWAAIGSGGGHVIQDEGTPLTQRANLNFVGAGVTVTDDPGNTATKVTIDGAGVQYREDFVVGTPSGNYSGSTTVFALLNPYLQNGKNLLVISSGVAMTPTQDYAETSPTSITFSTPREVGSKVSVMWTLGPVTQAFVTTEKRQDFIATAGQTVFNLTLGSYQVGGINLKVVVGGALLTVTQDYTENSGTQFTLSTPVATGVLVSAFWQEAQSSTLGDAATVDGFNASATPTANTLVACDADAQLPVDASKRMFMMSMLWGD